MKPPALERALIVGLGSIGKRHLANLRELCPETQIGIWRHSRSSANAADVADACYVFFDFAEVADFAPQIAIIANPASHHLAAATQLADCGVHLLVEKPLADRVDGLDELVERCRSRKVVLMTGYTLRFTPSLRAVHSAAQSGVIGRVLYARAEVGLHLELWRPGGDYRNNVSARRELGGGAVLELTHELDYIRWICGEVASLSACVDRLSDLEIDVEDTAEIILRFRSGAIGSVHLDMVQRTPVRKCQIVGSDGRLDWDGVARTAVLQKPGLPPESICPPWTPADEMYHAELRHFLHCVATDETPIVTGEDGLRTVQMAEAVKRSSLDKRWIELP